MHIEHVVLIPCILTTIHACKIFMRNHILSIADIFLIVGRLGLEPVSLALPTGSLYGISSDHFAPRVGGCSNMCFVYIKEKPASESEGISMFGRVIIQIRALMKSVSSSTVTLHCSSTLLSGLTTKIIGISSNVGTLTPKFS